MDIFYLEPCSKMCDCTLLGEGLLDYFLAQTSTLSTGSNNTPWCSALELLINITGICYIMR